MKKYKTLSEQLDRMIELSDINEKIKLSEGGYSRLSQIMHGDIPTVKTIGIMTSENPQGKQLSAEENNKRNKKFEDDLKNLNYSFHKIKGKFEGIKEKPFFIFNIRKEALIKFGEEYDQKSIIYGERIGPANFEFQYIEGDIVISRKIFHSLDDKAKAYSEYKGRKFIIPFFDEEYKEAKWDGGVISFKSKDLPLTEEIQKKVEWIKSSEKELWEEGMSGRRYWEIRGVIKIMLFEIQELLNKKII